MATKQQVVRRLALAATAACRGAWRREAAARILKGAALLGLVAVIVTTLGAVKAAPTAMPVKGNAPISLYGGGAASMDDCLRRQARDCFRWTGGAQMTRKRQGDRT